MAIFNTRWVAAGALAVAAFSGPLVAGLSGSDTPQVSATGKCLAWFGSRDDGQCLGYSNGSPTVVGTPNLGIYGPNTGNGLGVTTGPLLPGQTFNEGLSP